MNQEDQKTYVKMVMEAMASGTLTKDRGYDLIREITTSLTLTTDDVYKLGYEDGKNGKAMNAAYMINGSYTMGYEDGKGDHRIETPVDPDYVNFNDPPEGFEWAGFKAVPEPYQYYLSKGGSATFLNRPRRNNQTRHILRCVTCGNTTAQSTFGFSCFCHPEIKGGS